MKLILVIGPSGSGKTTLIEGLITHYPNLYEKVVTVTTRLPRRGEQNGIDYEFVSIEQFKEDIGSMVLVRNRQPCLFYGTRKSSLIVNERHKILATDYRAVDILLAEKLDNLVLITLQLSDESKQSRMLSRGDSVHDIEFRVAQERAQVFSVHPKVQSFIFDASDSIIDLMNRVHFTLSMTG